MILKYLGWAIALSLVLCIYFILKKHQALKNADHFPGKVVGYETRSGVDGPTTTYALKIKYYDALGISHQFVAPGASQPPSRPIGADVMVFQPRDGEPPAVLIFQSLYLGLWIWLCAGIGVLGCMLAPTILKYLYLR